MSLETALRFEADRVPNPNLKKAYENQVERIKYDEKMADRDNVVRLHKFNDFWDNLVVDIDHIVKKAAGEDVDDTEEKRMELFDVLKTTIGKEHINYWVLSIRAEEIFLAVRHWEKNINQRAAWNENLEEASWKKRIKNEAEVIKSEMRMAAKAALAVRRVALKQLFEKEFEMYEKELSLQGKTFYKQRI